MNFPAKPGSQARDPGQVEGPLFPFGHGLSYTKFAYTNLVITPTEQGPGGKIEVACDVKNIGAREGDEVVQLYLRDDYSSVTTYEKVLRGFERVRLKPGETKTVRFTLTPEHLELFDRNDHWVVEPGRFTVIHRRLIRSLSGSKVHSPSQTVQPPKKPRQPAKMIRADPI